MEFPLDLRFKLMALASRLKVTDVRGDLVYFVRQKALKLKEAVTVFADEGQTRPLYHPAYVLAWADGEAPILRVVKRAAFFEGRFRIDALRPAGGEALDVAVVAVLMMVLLERTRG